MKITPLEIRQKQFERKFRGYDVDEVHAFISSLSMEWERVMDENKELRLRFENAEREVQKLREVETTLFKTLKTAEDTGNNLIDQANRQAELLLRETQMRADTMISEAKSTSKTIVDEAEDQAKSIVSQARDDLKSLTLEYREIENKRDNILQELKTIVGDISERLERYNRLNKIELFNKYDEKPNTTIEKNSPQTQSTESPKEAQETNKEIEETDTTSESLEMEENTKVEKEISNSKKSFFDQIE